MLDFVNSQSARRRRVGLYREHGAIKPDGGADRAGLADSGQSPHRSDEIATVVSVTMINGGSRFNIVPDSVELSYTIRTYDAGIRAAVHRDIRQIAENIAARAKAEVEIIELYDPLENNEQMTTRIARNAPPVVTPA